MGDFMEKEKKFKNHERLSKRFGQGLIRLCIYGAILIAGEVFFYTLSKIGRLIPVIKYLFAFNWRVDEALQLNHIWDLPIYTFYGQASLYMFFVYGLICVLGLEPAYRWMKKKDVPYLIRGILYMIIILVMEWALGWILYWATGLKIWYYDDWGSFPIFTSFAIAPIWYICGLISEIMINVFDISNNTKLSLYVLAAFDGEKCKNSDKIADKNINKFIINKDFPDSWLCHTNKKLFDDVDVPFSPELKNSIQLCDEVWYIPGNHDMGITQNDLNAIVSENGKTMILFRLNPTWREGKEGKEGRKEGRKEGHLVGRTRRKISSEEKLKMVMTISFRKGTPLAR